MILKILKKYLFPRKIEDYPLSIKWKEAKEKKELAKKCDDFRLFQIATGELHWYQVVYNHYFKIEQDSLNRLNSRFDLMITGKISEDDKKIIELNTYKRIKDIDLIIPEVFDLNSKLHYQFCSDISDDFQETHRELNNQGNYSIKNKDLHLNKILIHRAISYMTKSNGFDKNDDYSWKEFWKTLYVELLCKFDEVK